MVFCSNDFLSNNIPFILRFKSFSHSNNVNIKLNQKEKGISDGLLQEVSADRQRDHLRHGLGSADHDPPPLAHQARRGIHIAAETQVEARRQLGGVQQGEGGPHQRAGAQNRSADCEESVNSETNMICVHLNISEFSRKYILQNPTFGKLMKNCEMSQYILKLYYFLFL